MPLFDLADKYRHLTQNHKEEQTDACAASEAPLATVELRGRKTSLFNEPSYRIASNIGHQLYVFCSSLRKPFTLQAYSIKRKKMCSKANTYIWLSKCVIAITKSIKSVQVWLWNSSSQSSKFQTRLNRPNVLIRYQKDGMEPQQHRTTLHSGVCNGPGQQEVVQFSSRLNHRDGIVQVLCSLV